MAAGDLTTLAKVKAHAATFKDQSGTRDADLERLVSAASREFVHVALWPILETTYTDEPHDGSGGDSLWLRHAALPREAEAPPLAVAAVSVDDVAVPRRGSTVDGVVQTAGWVAGPEFGRLRLVGSVFTRGVANVLVTYTVGWPLEALPPDVEQAVIEGVLLAFQRGPSAGVGYQVVDGQVVDMRGSSAMFAHSMAAAERYRPLTVG